MSCGSVPRTLALPVSWSLRAIFWGSCPPTETTTPVADSSSYMSMTRLAGKISRRLKQKIAGDVLTRSSTPQSTADLAHRNQYCRSPGYTSKDISIDTHREKSFSTHVNHRSLLPKILQRKRSINSTPIELHRAPNAINT